LLNNAGTFTICDDFTTNPASITVKSGSDALFNVSFPDSDAKYTWQLNNVNTVDGINLVGSTNDSLLVKSVTMSNNGELYRCIVNTRFCNVTSTAAKLTTLFKTCTLITTQPSNTNLTVGSDAKFSVVANDKDAKFTWGSDLDLGMQNLPANAAKYVGTETNNLTVKSISLRNHKQPFRVIAFTNVCIDTSNTALISVVDSCISFKSVKVTDTLVVRFSVKVANVDKGQLVKVYPNPAQDKLTIDNGNFTDFSGYTVNIYNTIGSVVYTQNINQQVYSIDLKTWGALGVYRLEVLDKTGAKVAVKSIILN